MVYRDSRLQAAQSIVVGRGSLRNCCESLHLINALVICYGFQVKSDTMV